MSDSQYQDKASGPSSPPSPVAPVTEEQEAPSSSNSSNSTSNGHALTAAAGQETNGSGAGAGAEVGADAGNAGSEAADGAIAQLSLDQAEVGRYQDRDRDRDSHGDSLSPPAAEAAAAALLGATAASNVLGDQLEQEQEQKSALLEANASQLEVASVADNLPSPKSFQSEEILLDVATGEEMPFDLEMTMAIMLVSSNLHRSTHKDEFGTQRVYKKTSPNCVLTLYLPAREVTLTGNNPSILRGIIYVDPKAIQGYRVYAQLTLTFRYGREDEEVMGLRFCNEAIMSLHQIWPRIEEPNPESLSPLQEALLKRLGDGAHPFTLTLTAHAPPSVQLVPAKRYYGAPIGTSYDVRCFIADKTDEKFHRRASVKMGVRVIYRTDVFHQHTAPENFAAFAGQQQQQQHQQHNATASPSGPASATPPASSDANVHGQCEQPSATATKSGKPGKSERGDSFPKLRLSPKSFRFSGRFGRSKSEIEKCPNDPFHSYSKSFQEHCDSMLLPHSGAGVSGGIGGISVGPCGGPQGSVDKPFLLQDGRVGLRASLDKGWYTHGEDINVTINIRNDSRKTVRKVRVCAIQHVDVCMFNNGKFKNVVADSDSVSPAVDRTVAPGATLNTMVVLRPQRGPTKNWIALEDTLQRSTEPDEITGAIAASALRSPNFVMQTAQLLAGAHCPLASPAMSLPTAQQLHQHQHQHQPTDGSKNSEGTGGGGGGGSVPGSTGKSADERNVFAIYVSYYVKVKLTLSSMGGELALKLPFVLVHVDETQRPGYASATLGELRMEMEKMALQDVPPGRRNGKRNAATMADIGDGPSTSAAAAAAAAAASATTATSTATPTPTPTATATATSHALAVGTQLDRIESVDDEFNISVPIPANAQRNGGLHKRRLQRSETLARDFEEHEAEQQQQQHVVQVHLEQPQQQQQDNELEEQEKPETESQQTAPSTGAVPKLSNV